MQYFKKKKKTTTENILNGVLYFVSFLIKKKVDCSVWPVLLADLQASTPSQALTASQGDGPRQESRIWYWAA